MDRKIEIGIISGVIVLLFIVCLVTLLTSDNEGPVIHVDEDVQISYAEGQEKSVLFEGVTAYDKKDGDVTDTLMIESMFVSGDTLKVRYAAKDKHNNVTIYNKYRDVPYTSAGISGADSEIDPVQEPGQEEQNESPGLEGENSETPSENESTDSPQEQTQGENGTENTEENTGSVDYTAPINREAVNATGIPVIRLTDNEVTIQEGASFQPLAYVAETYDDSGDVSRRIRISDDYNTRVAGDYKITFYVTDEDGNTSEPVILILHVQGD